MKSIIILFFFLFSFNWLSAQKTIKNSFVINDNKSSYTNEFISASIQKANFETYRLKDKRVTISCDNGFSFELLSSKELHIAGENIDPSKYNTYEASVKPPVFNLQQNGYFVNKVSFVKNPKKKSLKK